MTTSGTLARRTARHMKKTWPYFDRIEINQRRRKCTVKDGSEAMAELSQGFDRQEMVREMVAGCENVRLLSLRRLPVTVQ